MSYVKISLIEGEKALYTGHISLWGIANLFAAALLCWLAGLIAAMSGSGMLTLVFALFGVGSGIYIVLLYQTTEVAVTNKRVISKKGVISRTTTEIAFDKVESVEVFQSIIGRLLDYGTIQVSGTGSNTATIPSISSPIKFRQAFTSALDAYDNHRSVELANKKPRSRRDG